MRFSTIAALAMTNAFTVSAAPTRREAAYTVTDADILQYALTLEHLENAFYKKALSEWPRQKFLDAGFTPSFYDQLKYVAHDEEGHVLYLEAGLTAAGAKPVEACTYSFPMTDPKGFVALASVIEGVGVSAKAYLTAAGSILVTEALHQSAQRNAIGEIPMANVFGTPLGINAVYTIASGFITSCPSTNAPLPVKAYSGLTLLSGKPTAVGAVIDLQPKVMPTGNFYATFVSGLQILPVQTQGIQNGMVMVEVPPMVEGQSYVFLTSDNSGNLNDSNILAGPAIIEVTSSSPSFDLTIS